MKKNSSGENHPVLQQPANQEIYVELKGSDIYHAVEQLEASIEKLSIDRARLDKRCLVVFNRNPMTGTDVQRNKVTFKKNYNAAFQLVPGGTEISLY
jgi:nucleotidyltransferase/DNA polymerase involved in DNA repair